MYSWGFLVQLERFNVSYEYYAENNENKWTQFLLYLPPDFIEYFLDNKDASLMNEFSIAKTSITTN